jgi:hypothetical protein
MSPEATNRLAALRSAPLDKWIALTDDEATIIAVGDSFAEVSQLSDAAGFDDPIILKTPIEWVPLSV